MQTHFIAAHTDFIIVNTYLVLVHSLLLLVLSYLIKDFRLLGIVTPTRNTGRPESSTNKTIQQKITGQKSGDLMN